MKRYVLMPFVLMLSLLLVLAGCGHSDQPTKEPINIRDGIQKLLTTAESLQNAVATSKSDQVKTLGPSLEDEWHSVEDQIKPHYPDMYAEVEKYLDPTVAGTKVTPVDKNSLLPLVDHLIKAVKDLSKNYKK